MLAVTKVKINSSEKKKVYKNKYDIVQRVTRKFREVSLYSREKQRQRVRKALISTQL